MNAGKMIKEARMSKGISIRELERKSGISSACISQWERGVHTPNVRQFDKLLKALEVTITIGKEL